MSNRQVVKSLFLSGLSLVAIAGGVHADNGPEHRAQQAPPIQLGTSGGNVNDRTRIFCCSGTLGGLVKSAGGTQYILSNSHVLALSGQGSAGQDISHRGMIDANCGVPAVVADLTAFVPFSNGSNCCDAAIAQVRAGQVRTDGAILDIGIPCNTTRTASVGLSVRKSGRTTGFTTGSVSAVGVTVSVAYPKKCGSAGGTARTFTNQIAIGPSSFSAGGDSGSVIFDSSNHAVGLLFAGSSSTTFANPINSVLSSLNVSMVGASCLGHAVENPPYSEEELAEVLALLERNSSRILARPGVLGHGVGLTDDQRLEIVIFVERIEGLQHTDVTFHGYPVRFHDCGGPIYAACAGVEVK
jgi:hypothetical protein